MKILLLLFGLALLGLALLGLGLVLRWLSRLAHRGR